MPVDEANQGASAVVARCGYNTAFAVALSPVPVVFLPEPQFLPEQLARARRFAELDRFWCVDPGEGGGDAAVTTALEAALDAPVVPRTLPFRFDGAARAAALLRDRAEEVLALG